MFVFRKRAYIQSPVVYIAPECSKVDENGSNFRFAKISYMTRLLIAQINKAVAGNLNCVLLPSSVKVNREVMRVLYSCGIIRGVEFRGRYAVVHLKQHY